MLLCNYVQVFPLKFCFVMITRTLQYPFFDPPNPNNSLRLEITLGLFISFYLRKPE